MAATIRQMEEIECKCGSVEMRMAVFQLFDLGYDYYRKIEDVQMIIDDVKRRHAAADYVGMTEGFELAFQVAAWELAHTASIGEIICWCERQHYFEIWEWENSEDE